MYTQFTKALLNQMGDDVWGCGRENKVTHCYANFHKCDEFYGNSTDNPISPLEIEFDGVMY